MLSLDCASPFSPSVNRLLPSTSSEEEDQLENDELDSDAEAEFLLDPSLQLGEWLNQLQVLSQHNVRIVIEETNLVIYCLIYNDIRWYTVLQLVNVKEIVVFGVLLVDSTKEVIVLAASSDRDALSYNYNKVLKEEIRF
ncbi:hypothetical protein T08_3129 [Trichinella sp. T8]|nr:hypothetical protein T08_3129 [Trichinella sp. T8]